MITVERLLYSSNDSKSLLRYTIMSEPTFPKVVTFAGAQFPDIKCKIFLMKTVPAKLISMFKEWTLSVLADRLR